MIASALNARKINIVYSDVLNDDAKEMSVAADMETGQLYSLPNVHYEPMSDLQIPRSELNPETGSMSPGEIRNLAIPFKTAVWPG